MGPQRLVCAIEDLKICHSKMGGGEMQQQDETLLSWQGWDGG